MPARRLSRLLWADQPQPARRQLRAFYRQLQAQLGPFTTHLARAQARLVAECWFQVTAASGAAITEAVKRAHGRGRRPKLGAVNTQQKRAALQLSTYDTALRRLQELAGPRCERTPAEILAELNRDIAADRDAEGAHDD
jgi:hypothetical protein